MSKQAMGVYSKTHLVFETALQELPKTLAGKVLEVPFNTNGVSSSQGMNSAETITGRRDAVEPFKGNIDTGGNVVVPLDGIAFGYWLTLAFGKPTTTTLSEGKYKHVFKAGVEQPSATIEKAFSNGVYATAKGLKVSKLGFQFGGDGELTASIDLIGCNEIVGDKGLSEKPVAVKMERFHNFKASLELDKKKTAIATQVDVNVDFGLDDSGYSIGSEGFRSRINEGIIKPDGKLTAFFDDKSFVEKAMNNTVTPLKITLESENTELVIDMPEVLFARKTPSIDGAKGIVQELDYSAFYKENDMEACIVFTLTNNVASYDYTK